MNRITFDNLPSTSTYLRENDLPIGTLVRAHTQSAGRGRRGNGFSSEAGGLYFSLSLPRSMPDAEMWAVTFMAANALCDTLEQYGARPKVKWVNDIYINERKVCGILCEVMADRLILGIGVNVENDLPAELAESATTLRAEGVEVKADALLDGIVSSLHGYIDGWDIPEALKRYRSRCMLTGRQITYTENGVRRTATAVGIADNGNLICTRDGNTFTLHSGEVFAVRSTAK